MITVTSPIDRAFHARRRRLLEQAMEDGNRRYREELELVYYQDHRPTHRGGHVAQESLGYAAALLDLGENTQRARTLIRAVLRHQNLDESDRYYGGFFWFAGQENVIDHNAVSFVVPWLGWLMRHHPDALGVPLCEQIQQAMRISLDGLLAHPSAWSYTNIFLLNIAAKFAIAEVCDDRRACGIAEEEWREWVDYTNHYGIVEYLSPTYTAVQIEALELILDSSAATTIHDAVQQTLDNHWKDLLLAFHESSGRVVGTLSRGKPDQYLEGRSPLNVLVHLHLGAPCGDLGCYNATHALAARELSVAVLGMRSAALPRALRRWLPMHGIERRTYLARDWALATQSGSYGLETSTLAVWKDGGFFHKAPFKEHRNYCQQIEHRALIVERWSHQDEAAPSQWVLFGRSGRPSPAIQGQDRDWLLAATPVAGGKLVLEVLAPHGYQVEQSEHCWKILAETDRAPMTCPLVAVAVSLGNAQSGAGRTLSLETRSDAWILRQADLQVRVPKNEELLYEGANWDVPRDSFLP